MAKIRTNNAAAIRALAEAGELIMCAVRAVAAGGTLDNPEASNPIEWAKAKIAEAEEIAREAA